MRTFINIVSESEESFKVTLEAQGPKHKLIYVNGVKSGLMSKESREVGNNRDGYGKQTCWTGTVRFKGQTIHVGPTEKVSEIKPKIERLIRSAIANQ
jgi:hypothetical protein